MSEQIQINEIDEGELRKRVRDLLDDVHPEKAGSGE